MPSRLPQLRRLVLALALVLCSTAAGRAAEPSFLTFESGPVRPLALSPDGSLLFACNIPDGQLEIFSVGAEGLTHLGSVPVGLEPVAVAARTDDEVWVVNHLSDSVSVIDVPSRRVVRTLLVGDEPRDLVFAGPGKSRAFVTTAHRGQHRTHPSLDGVPGAGDPQLTTPGIPRADVWVFDAGNLEPGIGGTPLRIVELFSDTPRALAASLDGTKVYAAAFHSGNRSTVIGEGGVCDGFSPSTPCVVNGTTVPGGVAPPAVNFEGLQAPEVGVIVQRDLVSGEWRDSIGRDWSAAVRFNLPDKDVFEIDVATLAETGFHTGVGTILFNMAVNPVNGKVYVSNFESQNLTRFEGPGIVGGSTVQGHLAEARVAILSAGPVVSRHLNKHIDYSILTSDPLFDPSVKNHSLTTPLDLVFTSDGATVYVAAFGSSKVGVYPTAALEDDSFDPVALSAGHLDVPGGGPAGLALDEAHDRLYVATRFDNGVAVLDLATGAELERHPLHNPEPTNVVAGRPFLYDAVETSANGEASCSSCHTFADFDSLAWDLGDPDGEVTGNPIPTEAAFAAFLSPSPINGTGEIDDFHPMKGPMTTQTLRGLARSGAMHWRGDRATGFFGRDAFDEALSFNNFVVAFPGLVGRASQPSAADMQKFTDFALDVVLPPNPVRALENSLTPSQQTGKDFYLGPVASDTIGNCNFCHTLDPLNGFFGTNGRASFENETQIVKIAHLRNVYQKVGMFGVMSLPFIDTTGDFSHQGDQVRGFGYLHDGAIDTVFRFFQATVFNPGFDTDDTLRRDVEAFMLAFDTDLAPIVGQQVTVSQTNLATVAPRVDLLIARAKAPFQSALLGGASRECDVVVKGRVAGEPRGWVLDPAGNAFTPDRAGESALGHAALLALASEPGQELTFTAAPPGSGIRMGIDRDLDAVLDGDDNCPAAVNPGQEDESGNGIGKACDPLFVPEPGAAAGALAAAAVLAALAERRRRVTAPA